MAARLVVGPGAEIPIAAPAAGLAVEAVLDGGLVAPPGEPLRAPDDEGVHWLALVWRDAAGEPSPVSWTRLVVDATPPRVVLAVDPRPVSGDEGRRWIGRGAVLTARAEDDLSTVARTAVSAGGRTIETDGAEASVPVGGSGHGLLTLSGWAEDAAGNLSGEARLEVALDPWPPQGRIECEGPCVEGGPDGDHDRVIAPATRLEAHVEDPESGVARADLQVDGSPAGEGGWDGPWEGDSYELAIAVADRVGNAGTVGPLRVAVDRSGPLLSWETDPSGGLEVRAEDRPAGVERLEWSPDGELWLPLGGRLSARLRKRFPGAGSEVLLRATDRVGNRTEEVASLAPGGGR